MKLLWAMIFSVLCLVPEIIGEETRILMDSYINGQRVTLAFDTGAEGPMLLRKTAKRLNLSITEAPDDVIVQPGQIKLALTEKCKFQLHEGGVENDIHFAVVDIPSYIDFEFEGFLGWGAIKHMMIEIDPSSHRLKARETLNFDKTEWKCLDILKDENVLIIKTSEEDETQDLLLIDTGHSDGLAIKSELWQQLVDDANDFHTTLSASYLPSVGLVVDKEIWIPEIRFGRLALHDIPATNGFEAVRALDSAGIDGSLGMWALSCYQWIIDGPAGKIYFKPNDLIRIPEKYDYNRLGTVFVPEDMQTTDALIAHVVQDSPAYRAGIRDGDELLKIGQLDATKWRTDPNILPLSQFWQRPAGTVIDLVLLRNGEEKNITVKLEEIFKPSNDR